MTPMNDEILAQINGDIATQGYAIQTVGSPEGGLGWTYTIGLEDRLRAELIVIGQEQSVAVELIARVQETIEHPSHGLTITGLGLTVACVAVDREIQVAGHWFGIAHLRRGHRRPFRFSAVQLVTAEEDGAWRWTPEQPILGTEWWS